MGKPRLPWKRGPAAWEVACASDDIKNRLRAQPRKFLSLRRTAKLLGISTQPVRDWNRMGHLKREGPRRQIALAELERFIEWLERRAKPFSTENYTERFVLKTGRYPYPFQTLSRAQFIWPKGQNTLTPQELAELIGFRSKIFGVAPSFSRSVVRPVIFSRLNSNQYPLRCSYRPMLSPLSVLIWALLT